MRVNLFKYLTMGCLVLFSLPMAYAQGSQYATVEINNNSSHITYALSNYSQTNDCFFSEQPNAVPPQTSASFTGDLMESPENCTIGFTLKDPKNVNCIDDPQGQLGHCYDVKFTYNPNGTAPTATVLDNSQTCSTDCTTEYSPNGNKSDVEVIITPSSK